MLRKALCAMSLVFVALLPAIAQDVPKVEVFGGYSWSGGNFHGWNASATGNINKRFGIVADFSGHYGSELGLVRVNQNAHSFLFGPRLSFRGKRLTPFVYSLFGATRFAESAVISGQHLSAASTGFSLAIGGGLDVKVNERIAIRAFQLDYFRPIVNDEPNNRGRLAFGVVLRLGKK
jgi:opacity protein-like surface antigen